MQQARGGRGSYLQAPHKVEAPLDAATACCVAAFEEAAACRLPLELDNVPEAHSGYGTATVTLTVPSKKKAADSFPQAFAVMGAWTKSIASKSTSAALLTNVVDYEVRILPVMGGVMYRTKGEGGISRQSSSPERSRSRSRSRSPSRAHSQSRRVTMPSTGAVAAARRGFSLADLRSGALSMDQMMGTEKKDLAYVVRGIKSMGRVEGQWHIALQFGGQWGALGVGEAKGVDVLAKIAQIDGGDGDAEDVEQSAKREEEKRKKNAAEGDNSEDDSEDDTDDSSEDEDEYVDEEEEEERKKMEVGGAGGGVAVGKKNECEANEAGGATVVQAEESNDEKVVVDVRPVEEQEESDAEDEEDENEIEKKEAEEGPKASPPAAVAAPVSLPPPARSSWEGRETLRQVLADSRHVSWFNICKWALQMARSMHWCHSQYMTLGNLSLDSVWLMPDLLVFYAAREAARRDPTDKQSVRARESNLQSMIRGLGKKRRRAFRAQRRLALQSRDAWLDPLAWVGEAITSSLKSFPRLAKQDYQKIGSLTIADKAKLSQLSPELEAFAVLQQRDLRQLGLVIVEMLLHRPLTDIEGWRMRSADFEVVGTLVDNLGRAPPPLRDLLKVCFSSGAQEVLRSAPPVPVGGWSKKTRELQNSSVLTLSLAQPFKAAVVGLKGLMKDEAAGRQFVKPTYWTRADERYRVFLLEQRVKRLADLARAGPKMARSRIREEEKKLEFALLTPEQQTRLRKKEALHAKAVVNSKRRRGFIHMASFRHFSAQETRVWLRDAIATCLTKAWELKRPTMRDRSKRLDINGKHLVEERLGPLTQYVMFKMFTVLGINCNALKAQGRGSTVQLTANEVNSDMKVFIRVMSHELSARIAQRCTATELESELETAQSDAAAKMEKSSLSSMLSPALFAIKKTSVEADFLVRSWQVLHASAEDLADHIMLVDEPEAYERSSVSSPPRPSSRNSPSTRGGSRKSTRPASPSRSPTDGRADSSSPPPSSRAPPALRPLTGVSRPGTTASPPASAKSVKRPKSRPTTSPNSKKGWIARIRRLVCVAVLLRFDEQRWQRESGRNEAACRLQSLCRLIKVSNIMRRVWGRARELHMKIVQREQRAAAEEKERRIKAGLADDKDKKESVQRLPEKLIHPRLLTAYRPSRESDPSCKGKLTLDVLVAVMFRQSNFGEVFTDDGGDASRHLGVTALLLRPPSPRLSSSTPRAVLLDLNNDVHGEVLLLLFDKRTDQALLGRAADTLVEQLLLQCRKQEQELQEHSEESKEGEEGKPPSLPASLLALPPEPATWTRQGFAVKLKALTDSEPFIAARAFGTPDRLRVRVRGLQPNCSYRFRAYLTSDLAPRQAWDRVDRVFERPSVSVVVFRPVAAAADAARIEGGKEEERRSADDCVDEEVSLRVSERVGQAHARHDMQYEDDRMRAIDLYEARLAAFDEKIAQGVSIEDMDAEAEAVREARGRLKAALLPNRRRTALEDLLVERQEDCDPLSVPLAPSVACVAAVTNYTIPGPPTLTGGELMLTTAQAEGEEENGEDDEEEERGVEEGEEASHGSSGEERRAVLSKTLLRVARTDGAAASLAAATALLTIKWQESPFDGGQRCEAFLVYRRLVLRRGSVDGPGCPAADANIRATSGLLWLGPWRLLVARSAAGVEGGGGAGGSLVRKSRARPPTEHSDRINLPAALPLAAVQAWRAAWDEGGGGASVGVFAQYRVRPRSKVGLGPYSPPFLAPLVSLVRAKLAPELSSDAQDVIAAAAFAFAPASASGAASASVVPHLLDTAAMGAAHERLQLRTKAPLSLAPVTEVQLAVAKAEEASRDRLKAARSDGGVAGRLKAVEQWAGGRSRGADGLLGATTTHKPATASPLSPKPVRATIALASSSPLHEPASQMAALRSSRRALAPIPPLRKWGSASASASASLGSAFEEQGEDDVERLVQEMSQMEALRDEYERQRRIQAQAQSQEQQEQKGQSQSGGGVVEALREVRTRSKADEWLLRLAKASPLKTEN